VTAFVLPDQMDSSAAAALRESLIERRGQDLALDGANVERFGGLCLQVLLSAAQAWALDGRSFGVVNASAPFGAAMERMGAHDLLSWRQRGAQQ